MTEDILAPYGDFTPAALAALNLRQLDPVAVFKAEEHEHSLKRLIENMQAARLGVYTTDLGQILIGVDESVPDLHPHERWRCMRLDTAHTWHDIEHHFGGLSNARLMPAMADNAHTFMRRFVKQGRGNDLESALDFWRGISYTFVNVEQEVARVAATTTLTPIEMHELIFDVALWREHHPEAGDMPAELLWRMHGFGRAVEYARENRSSGEDEDAFL